MDPEGDPGVQRNPAFLLVDSGEVRCLPDWDIYLLANNICTSFIHFAHTDPVTIKVGMVIKRFRMQSFFLLSESPYLNF